MKNTCKGCGYLQIEGTHYYCNDRDCKVDLFDPECNYDN